MKKTKDTQKRAQKILKWKIKILTKLLGLSVTFEEGLNIFLKLLTHYAFFCILRKLFSILWNQVTKAKLGWISIVLINKMCHQNKKKNGKLNVFWNSWKKTNAIWKIKFWLKEYQIKSAYKISDYFNKETMR